jgi:tetratricopeptide (TPR) repeat protein
METISRSIFRKILIAGLLPALLIPFSLAHAQASPEKVLLDKARALAASGHLDIAVQTWQQVLLADPNEREALAGIAKADMQLGNPQEAKKYLDRLRAAGGNSADISKIESTSSFQSQADRIAEAGRLAQAGRYDEAMRIYRDIFSDKPPAGNNALVYYDTEAAIPAERPQAIAGLRGLVKQFPANSTYAVTLGRVLTYDAKTRTEGIAILRRYEDSPEAKSALDQAETWNAAAQTAGQTTTQADTDSKPEQPHEPAGDPLEASAYRALNKGNFDEAREDFQNVLAKHPNDAGALSGMGYVAMRQQDFAAAEDFLGRARAAGAPGLESAIGTARFWQSMAQAAAALKAGDSATAVAGYRAALSLKASNPDALEGLGGALAQAGDQAGAVDAFERVVRAQPARATAWLGVLRAQSGSGNAQEALDTDDRIPEGVRKQLAANPEYLGDLAQDDRALGRQAEADRVIQQALALPFPNGGRDMPPERQMEYGSLLLAAKKYGPAMRLYQQIVVEDPENTGAWLALITALHQSGDDDEALATAGSMPQPVFSRQEENPSFLVLIGSIYQSRQQWDRAQKYLERALTAAPASQSGISLQLASVYSAEGDPQKAFAMDRRVLDQNPDEPQAWSGLLNALHQMNRDQDALRQMAQMPEAVRLRLEGEPGYLTTQAGIQSAMGATQAALATFRQIETIYRSENAPEPIDTQLLHGWVLLKANDYSGLYALATSLAREQEMTDSQKTEFRHLWSTWSLQQANGLLAAGDQRRALAILESAAQAFPRNPDIESALAAAYLKAGQPKQAVLVYSTLDLIDAPLAQNQGAIGAALAANDLKHADAWLQSALVRFKNDPTILKLAAQFEQARGDDRRAAAYYQAALNAMGSASPGDLFSPEGSGLGGAANPEGEVSPGQRLMQLLSPAPDAPHKTVSSAEWTDGLAQSPSDQNPEQRDGSAVFVQQKTAVATEPTLGDFVEGKAASQRFAPTVPMTSNPDDDAQALAGPRNVASPISDAGFQAPPADPNSGPHRETKRQKHAVANTRPASLDMLAPTAARLAAPGRISAENVDPPLLPAVRQVSQVEWQSVRGQANDDSAAGVPAVPSSAPEMTTAQSSAPEMVAVPSGAQPTAQSTDLPPLTGPMVPTEHATNSREEITNQLASIEGASSGWLGGASGVDYRSGQPGYDRLSIYSAQIESSGMLGPNIRTTVIARPVILDSGTATSAATFQQGTLQAAQLPYLQSAAGVGGEFQIRTPYFGASIGTTPHGFLVENTIGSLLIHPPSSHYTLTFSRDPILDTQLSYAGLRDLGSRSATYVGNTWGGVVTDSGELQLAFGDDRSGWYIQGGGQYITGRNVESNRRIDGDSGAYWGVWSNPDYGKLTLGLNFFGMHYDSNLRYFTYGQGGYFSPGAYMLAGIPFTFDGHDGPRFHYRVTGSPGIQAFQEDSTPYYPLDLSLQEARGNPYYPEDTKVGGNYSLDAQGAYAIADHWFVGGYLDFNNTRDYASSKLGFFVRYVIRSQPSGEDVAPTGLFSEQGLRPMKVP